MSRLILALSRNPRYPTKLRNSSICSCFREVVIQWNFSSFSICSILIMVIKLPFELTGFLWWSWFSILNTLLAGSWPSLSHRLNTNGLEPLPWPVQLFSLASHQLHHFIWVSQVVKSSKLISDFEYLLPLIMRISSEAQLHSCHFRSLLLSPAFQWWLRPDFLVSQYLWE